MSIREVLGLAGHAVFDPGLTVQGQIPWGYGLTTWPGCRRRVQAPRFARRGLGPDKIGCGHGQETLRSYSGSKRQDKSLKISGKGYDNIREGKAPAGVR